MNLFNGDENLQRRYADALKTSIDKTFGIEMNNEPVAWMYQDDEGRSVAVYRDTLPCGAMPLYTHPVKKITEEEINIVKEAVGNYVCTIKMEIDQEKQTFKGYEHCSNLPSLRSELKDAEQALAILRKAQEQ